MSGLRNALTHLLNLHYLLLVAIGLSLLTTAGTPALMARCGCGSSGSRGYSTLVGRVLIDGRPLARARVFLAAQHDSLELLPFLGRIAPNTSSPREVQYVNLPATGTNTDGSFMLPALTAGTYKLVATYFGHDSYLTEVTLDSADFAMVEIELFEPRGDMASIVGAVQHTACGEPVKNGTLQLFDDNGNAIRAQTEDGEFEFGAVPAGRYTLQIYPDQDHAQITRDVVLAVGEDLRLDIDVPEWPDSIFSPDYGDQDKLCGLHDDTLDRVILSTRVRSVLYPPVRRIYEERFPMALPTVQANDLAVTTSYAYRCRLCFAAHNAFVTDRQWQPAEVPEGWDTYTVRGELQFRAPTGVALNIATSGCVTTVTFTDGDMDVRLTLGRHVVPWGRIHSVQSMVYEIIDERLVFVGRDPIDYRPGTRGAVFVGAWYPAMPYVGSDLDVAIGLKDEARLGEAYAIIASVRRLQLQPSVTHQAVLPTAHGGIGSP